MAQTVNRVTLIGYVVREPEIRDFPSGGQVLSFTVKTMDQWTDRQTGELREISQQNRVAVFVPQIISSLRDNLNVDDLVYVEGKLVNRRYQDNMGNDRFITEVAVRPYHGHVSHLGSTQLDVSTGNQQQGGYSEQSSGGFERNRSSHAESDGEDQIPF